MLAQGISELLAFLKNERGAVDALSLSIFLQYSNFIVLICISNKMFSIHHTLYSSFIYLFFHFIILFFCFSRNRTGNFHHFLMPYFSIIVIVTIQRLPVSGIIAALSAIPINAMGIIAILNILFLWK